MVAASWRHSFERGNVGPFGCRVACRWTLRDAFEKGKVGPSGDTKWHDDGFSKMTLKGLGWTHRGLRG